MRFALCLSNLTWAVAAPSAAQDAGALPPIESKFPLDDADPERSVPSKEEAERDPMQMGYLLVTLTQRAEQSMKQGLPSRAARYFRAIGKASPERALAFRKACAAHEQANEIVKAIDMCRAAIGKIDTTPDDLLKYLSVVFRKRGEFSRGEISDIDGSVARLKREVGHAGGRKLMMRLTEVQCRLGARLNDMRRLGDCVDELEALHAEPVRLLPQKWSLAMSRDELDKADQIKDEAVRAGLPDTAISFMERGLNKAYTERDGPVLAAARRWWPAAVGLLVALVLGAVIERRRRAPRPAP